MSDSENGVKGSFDSLDKHIGSMHDFKVLPEDMRNSEPPSCIVEEEYLLKKARDNYAGGRHMSPEHDPSGKSNSDPGAKMDAGKPRVDLMFKGFPRALLATAEVTTHGAIKYTELGFLEVENGESRYADAGGRHMLYRFIEGEIDSELPVFHLAQKAWNALAELEFACKRLNYPEKPMKAHSNEAK